MQIELTLRLNPFVEMPVVLLPNEEKVELVFTSPLYRLDALAVTITHSVGDEVQTFKKVTRGEPVDITHLCRAGEMKITVALLHDDEVLKRWRIEPLLLKEVDNEILPIPAIEAMRAEIKTLKADLDKTKQALTELYDLVTDKSI